MLRTVMFLYLHKRFIFSSEINEFAVSSTTTTGNVPQEIILIDNVKDNCFKNTLEEIANENSQLINDEYFYVVPNELLEVYACIKQVLIPKLEFFKSRFLKNKKYFSIINLKYLDSESLAESEKFLSEEKIFQEAINEGSFISSEKLKILEELIVNLAAKNRYIHEDSLAEILDFLKEIIKINDDLLSVSSENLNLIAENNSLKLTIMEKMKYHIFCESLMIKIWYFLSYINSKIENIKRTYTIFIFEKNNCVENCNNFLNIFFESEAKKLFEKIRNMESTEGVIKSLISKNEHLIIFDILSSINKINQLKIKTNNFKKNKEIFLRKNKKLFEFIFNNEFHLNDCLKIIDTKDLFKIINDFNLKKFENKISKKLNKYNKFKDGKNYTCVLEKLLKIKEKAVKTISKKEYSALLRRFFKLNFESYYTHLEYYFDIYTVKNTYIEIINYLEHNITDENDSSKIVEKRKKLNEYIPEENFNDFKLYFITFFKGNSQECISFTNRIMCEFLNYIPE